MNNFSDTNWAVSNPNRQLLKEQFQKFEKEIGHTKMEITAELFYEF
jgi:hypothetical protein